MGKEINEFLFSDRAATSKICPEAVFAVKPAGPDYFYINYELLNPFEDNEEMTDRVVGYSVADIYDMETSAIPDIDEVYDIPPLGIANMKIREIVALIQEGLLKQESPHCKTA
jgi:hypothetical protein